MRSSPMDQIAPARRSVTLSLDEGLLRRAEALGLALETEVEAGLVSRLAKAEEERRRDEMVAVLNEMDAEHGAFADEHLTL